MSDFKKDFLDRYLQLGLGSMPKSDVDALVMHLLDIYGYDNSGPLEIRSNQAVSEILKTPVAKVKKMRYEAALKYGGRVEDQAKGRFLSVLSNASLEADGEKVLFIIEDSLTKNWLQGQLKIHQHIFDHSFNAEIVKVSFTGLIKVLESFFDKEQIDTFKADFEIAKKKKNAEERVRAFKEISKKFAEGAASAAGNAVKTVFKSQCGLE